MISDNQEIVKSNLPFFLQPISADHVTDDEMNGLGELIMALIPVISLSIMRIAGRGEKSCRQFGVWKPGLRESNCIREIKPEEKADEWAGLLKEKDFVQLTDRELLLGVRHHGLLQGMIYLERGREGFSEDEIRVLSLLVQILAGDLFNGTSAEEQKLSNYIFNTMLDGLKASLYITDPETDRILFMNRTMKKEYGIEEPEGKICWKILQKGMEGRCAFCPVRHLQEQNNDTVYQWEEVSTVTGRSYRNYDSLIPWTDGSLVHLQQSMDITELKTANTDELTQLLVRRPGKEALKESLIRAVRENHVLTVCLYDINLLKETNDKYGHAEGDRMIVTIAEEVQRSLQEEEYSFRLSGDEFIVVFRCSKAEASKRMNGVLESLRKNSVLYSTGFCFGLAEVWPDSELTMEEVLLVADEQMYEQKKQFHILHNEKKLLVGQSRLPDKQFTYDKERLLDALIQSTEDYIYVCNMKTGIFQYSKAMIEEFELPSQVIENAAAVWGARVHEEDRAAFLEANQMIADGRFDSHCVEYRALNWNGEWVWVRCRGHLERDEQGEPVLFAGFITNLGKKNKIDHLTGLYNKIEFEEQIQHLIRSDSNHMFGIMILGIDNLKHINDLYDRNFGDEVIRLVSQKIQSILPENATIYKLDGDEYGIISRKTGRVGMEDIYNRIYKMFEYQQEYKGRKYYSTLSAGCALCPGDAEDYTGLMKYAGYAMQHAKRQGKQNCTFFSVSILNYRTRSLGMVEALRESAENQFEGFSLRYQPLVDAKTGKTVGMEALARWNHVQYGEVSPMEFIPLLEASGLIIPVGKWILATALHTTREWMQSRPALQIHINISYLQMEGPNFVSFLKEKIEQEHYPTQNLVLEMTESVMAKEEKQVRKILDEVRKAGIRIAMDDFGTGYSALGILKESPADIVKIDRAFMKDILTSSFDTTFIKFVVALCHDVGIKVCLEGVETQEEYDAVFQMGLDMIQGYYFGHPMEEKDFYQTYIIR